MSTHRFKTDFRNHYPVCFELLPILENILLEDEALSEVLGRHPGLLRRHPFLLDLARIEESSYRLITYPPPLPERVTHHVVNPALELLLVNWQHLPEFLSDRSAIPEPGDGYVLVLMKPGEKSVEIRSAEVGDLLALKIVAEGIESRKAAAEGGVAVGAIDNVLYRGEQLGLILAPPTRIRRPPEFPKGEVNDPEFFSSSTFTLQWHITQTCDLDCRHCYDRSDREAMTLEQALGVLDDLYDFCREHHVFGQVSLSGGNPMLYPHFDRLYSEAAERGFMTAVLGNPMPRNRIERMLAVQKPEFYQISLEGMKAHNDFIRGSGHYDRVLDFLKLLGELEVYRMVMLTLTRDNMYQVLKLADRLKGLTELFTFNRLAAVGRGAELSAVPLDRFPDFLDRYVDAAETNPCMGLKDNLFNLLRWQRGLSLGGGCAGHGCGAAFNFVALLPDGEVHACRKMPSLIGNIYRDRLNDIYYGSSAHRFRAGSKSCSTCPVRPVCGGCPAVSYGFGRDIFNELDPYCFRNQEGKTLS
ncbi:MAG TPA: selenobiotic family peptide radical SAM maturase [Desulfobacteraceae bacterium]|nr:selenobiotic family peptide radical SAM maturase [Desulfobacteraceae bacterium]